MSEQKIEVPPEVSSVIDSLTHQEVQTLFPKFPTSLIIPPLDRFKSAPWNFNKLLLLTSEGEELIFYDDESVVVVSKMQMIFRTRTTLKLFKLQLQPEDMPKALSLYNLTQVESTYNEVNSFIYQHLVPCISTELRGAYQQGHLNIYKFWCGTNLVPPERSKETIYNHTFTNAKVSWLCGNVYIIFPTSATVVVESPDHPRLEIQVEPDEILLAYHPPPQRGAD